MDHGNVNTFNFSPIDLRVTTASLYDLAIFLCDKSVKVHFSLIVSENGVSCFAVYCVDFL